MTLKKVAAGRVRPADELHRPATPRGVRRKTGTPLALPPLAQATDGASPDDRARPADRSGWPPLCAQRGTVRHRARPSSISHSSLIQVRLKAPSAAVSPRLHGSADSRPASKRTPQTQRSAPEPDELRAAAQLVSHSMIRPRSSRPRAEPPNYAAAPVSWAGIRWAPE